ncbi:MAG: F0F1 ATP synthase subunit delta [Gammaproteobacteria bacterium]
MTELLPLARPYAQAVFEYAVAQQHVAEWSTLLETLAKRVEQPIVQQMLHDPRYTVQQLAEIVVALTETKLGQAEENFIALLAENHRLALLPQIATLFAEYVAAHEKNITVDVSSAIPLGDQERKNLQQTLTEQLGLAVNLNCKIEPDLLGGLRLRMGDKVIDNSIRGQFAQLKTMLLG